MFYRFVQKEGNIVGIGDIDMEQLNAKVDEYFNEGYTLSTLPEYVAQVITAAASKPEEGVVSEPAVVEEVVAEAPVEPQA